MDKASLLKFNKATGLLRHLLATLRRGGAWLSVCLLFLWSPALAAGSGTSGDPFTTLSDAYAVSSGRYFFNTGSGLFQADVDGSEGGGWALVPPLPFSRYRHTACAFQTCRVIALWQRGRASCAVSAPSCAKSLEKFTEEAVPHGHLVAPGSRI